MTLPRVSELMKQWSSNPPMHKLVAAYVGFAPKPAKGAVIDVAKIADFPGIVRG